MIEWEAIFKALAAAIGAVSQARQLNFNIKSTKENQRLSEVLTELKQKAYKVSVEMESELREINYQLEDMGIDRKKSLNQIIQDLRWYNGITRIKLKSVVSPFYGLCEIFEKMTAIYGVLIFQKQPYMVLKQNWRNYS
jgi:hypothetical protein